MFGLQNIDLKILLYTAILLDYCTVLTTTASRLTQYCSHEAAAVIELDLTIPQTSSTPTHTNWSL